MAGRNNGKIQITGDEKKGQNNEMVKMNVHAILPSGGYNFFILSRYLGPQQYVPIYKSEIQPQGQGGAYIFNEVSQLTSTLCREDVEREIKFEFYKSQKSGRH